MSAVFIYINIFKHSINYLIYYPGSADSEAERKYVDDKDREKKDEDDEEEVVETGKVFGEADPFGSTVNARSKL